VNLARGAHAELESLAGGGVGVVGVAAHAGLKPGDSEGDVRGGAHGLVPDDAALGVLAEPFERGVGIIQREPVEFQAVTFLQETHERMDDFPLPILWVFEVEAGIVAIGQTLQREEQCVHRHVAIEPPVLGQRDDGGGRGSPIKLLGRRLGAKRGRDGQKKGGEKEAAKVFHTRCD